MTEPTPAGASVPETKTLLTPAGINQIIKTSAIFTITFNPTEPLDVQWPIKFLDYAALPVPLMLSFDHSKTITHFRCHKLLVDTMEGVFSEIKNKGLEPETL